MKRLACTAAVAVACAVTAPSIDAYLKLGSRIGTRTVTLRWEEVPVRYFVSNAGVPGVSAQQFQTALARAFGTWDAVETADISNEFAGFTAAPPLDQDDASVLGFRNRPELDRVLAATNFLVDTTSGEIVESDIFFNSAFPWSVAAAGETGRFDLESIALHEIGHFLGLGHSALGETELGAGGRRVLAAEAVMFPIAFSAGTVEGRSLRPDDIAGISDIYPTTEFRRDRGSISGRVTKNGAGVFGAHVTAFHLETGQFIATFTLSDEGTYTVAGLAPGPHVLRVEPLDDGDIESFFDASQNVDVNFRVKFHERVVAVPEGGGVRNIDVRVVAK
jgi:Matrixin/Carboxypeptidase regulatory-like domain